MPRVSIVTLCHNYGDYLVDCIGSVLDQTHKDFEHIVIDAASDDSTSHRMADWQDAKLLYMRLPKDPGICSSKNAVIPYLDSEYLVFLDADDKVHPQFLEKLLSKAGPKTLVCPGLQEFEAGSNAGWPSWGTQYQDFCQNNRIFCCSMMPTKEFIDLGGYDPALDRLGCEDWELWCRLTQAGCKVVIVPEILFYYRVHAGSHTARFSQYDEERIGYIKRKHHV